MCVCALPLLRRQVAEVGDITTRLSMPVMDARNRLAIVWAERKEFDKALAMLHSSQDLYHEVKQRGLVPWGRCESVARALHEGGRRMRRKKGGLESWGGEGRERVCVSVCMCVWFCRRLFPFTPMHNQSGTCPQEKSFAQHRRRSQIQQVPGRRRGVSGE